MNTRFAITLLAAAGIGLGVLNTRAEVDFAADLDIHAVSDFYDPLAPLGSWVDVQHYGRCWHPAHVAADWRPYCNGHWEWTDVGWYWVSDEPWAWACYHYGSWLDDANYGWIWVPGVEWAPSWVVWRESPEYIGWAPYAPAGVVVAVPLFVFVDVHHFRDHFHRNDLIVSNPRISRRTRVVNHFRRERRDIDGVQRTIAINEGPGIDPIQRATGTKLSPVPVRQVIEQTPVPDRLRRRLTPTGVEPRRENHSDERERTGQQPRNFEQQQPATAAPVTPQQRQERTRRPEQTIPERRDQRDQTMPPTGNREQRIYPPQSPTGPTPRPPLTVPQRPVPPVTPERPMPPVTPERPVRPTRPEHMIPPPTGRGREITPPPREMAPPARGLPSRTPIRPEGPPPNQPQQDRNRRDNDQQ